MPLYEYQCLANGHSFEVRHPITQEPVSSVPHRSVRRRWRAHGLRARPGRRPTADALHGGPERGRTKQHQWLSGLAPLPDQVRLGGDFREGLVRNVMVGVPVQQSLITMRADLFGDMKLGRFRMTGNIGYIPQGDLPDAITSRPSDNIISREHWVGVELDDDGAWLLRAGKMALPFGIRMIEHTLWARALTQTDLDATQQYGLALSFARGDLRGEAMGIAGHTTFSPRVAMMPRPPSS